jgi:hypothetical protein
VRKLVVLLLGITLSSRRRCGLMSRRNDGNLLKIASFHGNVDGKRKTETFIKA